MTSNDSVTCPPQHCPIAGPSGSAIGWAAAPARTSRARSMASSSSRPPPMVPKQPLPETSIHASVLRGVDPLASTTLTSTKPCSAALAAKPR
jgi:hypothetical protein